MEPCSTWSRRGITLRDSSSLLFFLSKAAFPFLVKVSSMQRAATAERTLAEAFSQPFRAQPCMHFADCVEEVADLAAGKTAAFAFFLLSAISAAAHPHSATPRLNPLFYEAAMFVEALFLVEESKAGHVGICFSYFV